MTTAEAIILAVVEGLTEFLPVSSTGHLILTQAALKLENTTFAKVFLINIQFGAILSVVFLYWRRFFQSFDFYFKLFVAFIPAAVLGFLLNDFIDSLLESVTTVAISLVVGGVVLIFVDSIFKQQIDDAASDIVDDVAVKKVNKLGIEEKRLEPKQLPLSYMQAFIIGCFQCIAMIPGVSRSAATIVGGLTQKLNMKRAAEFSFFLAVPTIFAAAAYKLLKSFGDIKGSDISLLLIGNAVSFIVGMIAIKFFIGLITRYGLRFFGYYRILLGLAILALAAMGHKLEIPD